MVIYRTQLNNIKNLSKEQYGILMEMCRYANNLYNFALYQVRQHYFAQHGFLAYEDNYYLCKGNENYKLLQAGCSQQILKLADRSFKPFFNLKRKASKGEYRYHDVHMPGYREKGGMYVLVFSTNAITVKDGFFLVPMSREFRKLHPGAEVKVPYPERLSGKPLKEVRIIPHHGKHFSIEYCYEDAIEPRELDPSRVMGIDVGVNNLAACVANAGTPFLVDGRKLKSINQYYNRQLAHYRSIAMSQGARTTKRIRNLALKRDRQVTDCMRKAARLIVNRCLEGGIGTVVCGYSKGWKQESRFGRTRREQKRNNQNFVQIPHGTFRECLASLCEKYGIRYLEQEESYTSQASFPDGDFIPTYVPGGSDGYTFSGKRIKRGLYRTGNGILVNADCNGAANIVAKSKQESQLDIPLEGLSRGVLDTPVKVRIS